MGLVVTCGLVGKKKLEYKINFCAKNEVKPREIQILPVLKLRHIQNEKEFDEERYDARILTGFDIPGQLNSTIS